MANRWCQKCVYGIVSDYAQQPIWIYPPKFCDCCHGGFWNCCPCCEEFLDKFFGDKEVITSDDGVYLKPVGTAEDNPFDPPPGYPRSFVNHRPDPTDDPPDSRPARLEGKTWD